MKHMMKSTLLFSICTSLPVLAVFWPAPAKAAPVSFRAVTVPEKPAEVDLWHYNEWNIQALVGLFVPENGIVVQAGASDDKAVFPQANQFSKGKVYVFEPNPQHFKKIRDHRFYFSNVVAMQTALSDTSGRQSFYLSGNEANKRLGSLLKASPDWKWYYRDHTDISVETVNLEEWAKDNDIEAVDFLILNCGGSELSILQSIPNLITSISAILVETHSQEFRKGLGLYPDVKQFLEKNGFFQIKHWETPGFQGLALFAKRGLAEVKK